MSRSYRQPFAKDGYKSKWKQTAKRNANQKVRMYDAQDDVPNGKAYRKITNPWSICDWSFEKPMPKGKSKTARRIRAKSVRK